MSPIAPRATARPMTTALATPGLAFHPFNLHTLNRPGRLPPH
jgi:hypothetical protein